MLKQKQVKYPIAEQTEAAPSATTFSFQRKPSTPTLVHLRDGEVVLYKRGRSRRWQARFKLFDGAWRRVTTKHIGLEYAARAACEAYDEARFRERLGLPQTTRRFGMVAAATVLELKDALAAGAGKSVYVDYVQVIERYLKPFFERRWITAIDAEAVQQFEAWRNEKMGRVPKSSTMLTHASAFSRVFDTAIAKGWLSDRHPVPRLSTKGMRSQARPAFTREEISPLLAFTVRWLGQAHVGRANAMRELLRDYVEVLLYTGMRHGTESMNLKWQHIDWYEAAETKQRYIRIWVSGKTGPRSLIAKHTVVEALERIRSRFEPLAMGTLDELLALKVEEWVFRLRDGTRPPSLNGTFRRLMLASGMLKAPGGGNRTLYSLRHTYATMALVEEGTDIHTLARQMGTSVVMIERHYSKLVPMLRAKELAA